MSATQKLRDIGVIPTVYSLLYAETRATFDELRTQSDLGEMYERAWTKHQDPMHQALLGGWQQWSRPVVEANWSRLPHGYVTAGSSEAIRDRVAAHATFARAAGRIPRIHVFEGEYEGFSAFAAAYQCEVVRHSRDSYQQSLLAACGSADRFFVSAPSSLDGNVWDGYDDFIAFVRDSVPDMRVSVDLCYVGSVTGRSYTIDLRSPCIDTVFFSLSKVFGVYYHRIGGVFCTEPALGLAGNIWFKNLLSIRFGAELMRNHDVFAIPRRVRGTQLQVIERMRAVCGDGVEPSDVVLLAHQRAGDNSDLDESFARGTSRRRYCLTPALDAALREPAP